LTRKRQRGSSARRQHGRAGKGGCAPSAPARRGRPHLRLRFAADARRRSRGFAAAGREPRRFNEIVLGLVFLTAALICRFTSITNTHIGR